MADAHDFPLEQWRALAADMELWADRLEAEFPAYRRGSVAFKRFAESLAPVVKPDSSAEVYGAQAGAGAGADRIEDARRRIIRVLHDPLERVFGTDEGGQASP